MHSRTHVRLPFPLYASPTPRLRPPSAHVNYSKSTTRASSERTARARTFLQARPQQAAPPQIARWTGRTHSRVRRRHRLQRNSNRRIRGHSRPQSSWTVRPSALRSRLRHRPLNRTWLTRRSAASPTPAWDAVRGPPARTPMPTRTASNMATITDSDKPCRPVRAEGRRKGWEVVAANGKATSRANHSHSCVCAHLSVFLPRDVPDANTGFRFMQ